MDVHKENASLPLLKVLLYGWKAVDSSRMHDNPSILDSAYIRTKKYGVWIVSNLLLLSLCVYSRALKN